MKHAKVVLHEIGGKLQFLPFNLPEGKSGKWEVKHELHQKGEVMTLVSMRNADG